MSKNLSLIFALVVFFSCKNDPNETTSTATPTPVSSPNDATTAAKSKEELFAEMKANAFDEDDQIGRINHSIGLIQKHYGISNKLRQEEGKRSISVDEKFTVLVRHEKGAKVTEQKINLIHLDNRNGGMHLIPDVEADDFPGFAIAVREGYPGVEIIENGKKISEERELKIFMNDRALIEQAVPAFLQALNVAHGQN